MIHAARVLPKLDDKNAQSYRESGSFVFELAPRWGVWEVLCKLRLDTPSGRSGQETAMLQRVM
jgi:hypothetical protein